MSKQAEIKFKPILYTASVVLILLNIALAVWLIVTINSASQYRNLSTPDLQALDQQSLEAEKLRQEVWRLTVENDRLASPWQSFTSLATFLTAVVAVAGVFVTIWKQFEERKSDREQREFESRRRLDEKFTSIITNISSDNRSLQMSSAVSLMTFLKPEYAELYEQVYLILLANLKLKLDPQVNDLLVDGFEKVLRIRLKSTREAERQFELDFSHTNLYRINLSGMELADLDIGFADLRRANLRESNLFRVKGIEANLEKARLTKTNLGEARLAKANLAEAHLHQTNLVAAMLKETNLKGAQFYQAKLQSAHLENADVAGARFEQADLNDTYFKGAKFDTDALRSILKAEHWDTAHFDEEITAKLAELKGKG